jgi:hypothetical protein
VQLTAGFPTTSPVPMLWLFAAMCAMVLVLETVQQQRRPPE